MGATCSSHKCQPAESAVFAQVVASGTNATKPSFTLNTLPYADSIPEYLQYGLTLPAMKEVRKQLPSDAMEQMNASIPVREDGTLKYPKNTVVNGYVYQHFIEIWGKEDGLSICERLRNIPKFKTHISRAQIFVTWALQTPMDTLLDAIEVYLEKHHLPVNSTYFCIFDFVTRYASLKHDLKFLADIVENTGHTVLFMEPWNKPIPLKRAFCIKEIYHTQKCHFKLDVMLSRAQQESFEHALMYEFDSIAAAFSDVDVRNGQCRKEHEKIKILKDLEEGVGIVECNKQVIGLLRKALTEYGEQALSELSQKDRATSRLINNLASLMMHQGEYTRALPLCQEAVEGRRNILGDTHPDTLVSITNLASVLMNIGNYDEAFPLCHEAVDGYKVTLGNLHEDTLTSIGNLALLLQNQGKYDEALPLFMESLNGARITLGNNDPDTFTALGNLASLKLDMGKYKEALPLCKEALTGSEGKLGKRHPITLQAMNNMACYYYQNGQYTKAQELFEKTLNLRKEVLGDEHPDTRDSMTWLQQVQYTDHTEMEDKSSDRKSVV